jgi:transcriptional regulator with XRE-family HTH domain
VARTISQYLTYSFVDKDPIIDRMRSMLDDEHASYTDVHEKSGVSVNTMRQWFDGKTRRPQYATIVAVARSLGYDITLTKAGKILKFKRTIRRRAA